MPSSRSILSTLPPTRFRDVGRPAAIAVVLATLVAIAALLMVATGYQPPAAAPTTEQGDLAM